MSYITHKAVSYSSLSQFMIAPDRLLLPFQESEATYLGKAFENILEAAHTPKDFKYKFIDVTARTLIQNLDITEPKLKKDGTQDKRYSAINEILDVKEQGYTPLPIEFKYKLDMMLESVEKTEVTDGMFWGLTAAEILQSDYQVERYGEFNDIPIKGKFDILHDKTVIDLKTTSNMEGFKWQYKDKYWVQDYIYSLLANQMQEPLLFLVTETVEPFNSRFVYRTNGFQEWKHREFEQKIKEYWDWYLSGKPKKYFRETELLSI